MKYRALFMTAISFISISAYTYTHAKPIQFQEKLAKLEKSADGKIGVYAINMNNNRIIAYRHDERFPTGSTFKIIGVAAVLKHSMENAQLLQQTMIVKQQDLTAWCPVTQKQVGQSMSLYDLSAAAMMYSDNTAIYLLMKKLGGPQEVVSFARSIGDDTFSMNSTPDNLKPTSTPAAMEKTLEKLTLGNILAAPQREQLITWMKNNTTGNLRIRAGVPKGWIVADKTGSGDHGLTNDIAIIWPPNRQPIVVAIYFVQKKENARSRPAVVAEVTRILLNECEKFN